MYLICMSRTDKENADICLPDLKFSTASVNVDIDLWFYAVFRPCACHGELRGKWNPTYC